MKPGNPEHVKRPYKGPPVSVRNKWYHINGVKDWLHARGITNSVKKFVVAQAFCMEHRGASFNDWDRTAIHIQQNWKAFTEWFNKPNDNG